MFDLCEFICTRKLDKKRRQKLDKILVLFYYKSHPTMGNCYGIRNKANTITLTC